MARNPDHKTAIILSTYNWPRALELTLTGLSVQTNLDFEVIVADDGSGAETRDLIERFRKDSPFPLRHVWQEDLGYRKTPILNEAVRSCDARQLMFMDQDGIPARNLLELHRQAFAPDFIVPGGYIRLSDEQSKSLDPQRVREGVHEQMMTRKDLWLLRKKHVYNLFYIATFRKIFPRIVGMNFSVDRALFEKVNGFDEEYKGWGTEDADIRTRMRLAGGRARCLWHKAFAFHQWHPKHPTKAKDTVNKRRYRELKRGKLPWRCGKGLARADPTPAR